jgi:hypothetical protein
MQVPPSNMIAVKDHPDYSPFFRLLKIGVPEGQVQVRRSWQLLGVVLHLMQLNAYPVLHFLRDVHSIWPTVQDVRCWP